MATPKKVSTAKAAPAAVGSTTAATGDQQALETKTDLQLAQANGGTTSTGAPTGAASTGDGTDTGADSGVTGDDSGAADGAGSGTGADTGLNAGSGTDTDAGAESGQGGESAIGSAAADPATLSDPSASNSDPFAQQAFAVVIRNHGSLAVNAGPGFLLLPCSTTPIPNPMALVELELLRSELVKLERENYLRPDTLTADATQIMETKT